MGGRVRPCSARHRSAYGVPNSMYPGPARVSAGRGASVGFTITTRVVSPITTPSCFPAKQTVEERKRKQRKKEDKNEMEMR